MTTTTRIEIPASQLRPGDEIVFADGAHWFGAFDVQPYGDDVAVFTTMADQDNGLDPRYDLDADMVVLVERRVDGPTTTHTTLTLHDDGTVAIDRN